MAWVLRLLPFSSDSSHSVEPAQRVAGLTLPLRMALAAQHGGAGRIELAMECEPLRPLLTDPRLRIPVTSADARQPDLPALRVDVPWNLVVHRDLLRDLGASGATGSRNLLREPHPFSAPFSFEPVLVISKSSARSAEKALLRALRKPQDGWTSTYLNRYLSLAATRWLAHTPLRPNQVSVAILGIGIIGALLASRGTYGTMLIGALLFQAQSVLDGCDGELSRVTYQGSHAGEWLDTVGDDLTNYGFFAGTAWGLYVCTHSLLYLAAGAVVVVSGIVSSAIQYRYLIRIGSGDLLKYPLGIGKGPCTAQAPKGLVARLLDGVSPLFKRDSFVLMTLIGAVLGLLGPILLIFAAGGVGILVAVLRAETRMARERRDASAASAR
ncbi:MAG: hypothetical protein MUF54_23535 [Polyangiaceae bacterium]|jgi:phosphatidylglycerophosphate synthase|nr:hypothetical protein [Polyangiaceae bacterium]